MELPSHLAGLDASSYTILVIDDTPNNLRVIADYLSQFGFRVLLARSGESGIQRALHGNPDLILLDILMPGIDGFETCNRLKTHPKTQQIPVIIMTALTEVEHKVKGFNVGAVDYVTKPIQHEEMLARIATHLRIRDLTFGLEKEVRARTGELEEAVHRAQQLSRDLEHALEREKELSHMRSQIIEIVSHEFRTPFTIIQQSTTLLTKYAGDLSEEKQKEVANEIRNSVGFMSRLLGDVFFINTMETSSLTPRINIVPLGDYCRRLRALLHKQFNADDRTRIRYFHANARVAIDEQLLNRLIGSLVSNALKFSDELGQVNIDLRVSEDILIGVVEDDGIGVPEQALPHIFDLFYRAANANPRRGLGVGLYISRMLAETMGGTIEATSRGQQPGTRFIFKLPVGSRTIDAQANATDD